VKVSISADKEALHGDVITLLDRVRSTGITKIGYQIREAQSAPH
jgi:biopolymer transport protein ExbD